MPKAALIMGSQSDFDALKSCIKTLKQFGIETAVRVISAHRTPKEAAVFSSSARSEGYEVLLCAAGKAAHLAGVMAAHTTLPVIGIPMKSTSLDGMDALLSTVQMPPGIPVATVAIDGGVNAALLAVQILSVGHPELIDKLERHRQDIAAAARTADAQMQDAIQEL